MSNKAAHHITAKIGDAGCIRLHVCSKSPSWTLDQPGTVSGERAAYASGPTLRDRRDDEQRGSPYDAKLNVAEIGAVNMGEIGAVRKPAAKKRALTTVARAWHGSKYLHLVDIIDQL